MRMILAAAVLAVLALPASAAKDNPYGPQWHFMDHDADMRLPIRPWCIPRTPQWATLFTCDRGESWTQLGMAVWWTTASSLVL
jgi:hypothetical protein